MLHFSTDKHISIKKRILAMTALNSMRFLQKHAWTILLSVAQKKRCYTKAERFIKCMSKKNVNEDFIIYADISVHLCQYTLCIRDSVQSMLVSRRTEHCSHTHSATIIPQLLTKFSERAGPTAWNSLTDELRAAPTLNSFKCTLKTHLFNTAFYHWFVVLLTI